MTFPCQLAIFLILNLLDLALTRVLVFPGNIYLREFNPVANWLLLSWGWLGLAGFKLGAVAVATSLFPIIARHRPRMATVVLNGGCCVVGAVVLYSGYLVGSNSESLLDLRRSEQLRFHLEQTAAKCHHDSLLLDDMAGDLAEGRCTLPGAIARLMRLKSSDTSWMHCVLAAYPASTPGESLAELLISRAVFHVRQDPERAELLSNRLHRVFEEFRDGDYSGT